MTHRHHLPPAPRRTTATPWLRRHSQVLGLLLGAGLASSAWAAEPAADKPAPIGKIILPAKPQPQDPGSKESMAKQVRDAIEQANAEQRAAKGKASKSKASTPQMVLTIESETKNGTAHGAPTPPPEVATAYTRAHSLTNPVDSRAATRAAALAAVGAPTVTHKEALELHEAGVVHWGYSGDSGPQAWARLKPEYNLCARGQRQSPIDIQDFETLKGPAEPLQINYQPSGATVLNNGHTIEVDVAGDNSLTVRGSTYKLVQFHFHHPSEEHINGQGTDMVAHLVHRNVDGQLAVLAVLLREGKANAMVNNVWTYMPLDTGDQVRMPAGLLNVAELLPQDQRYYQFMGSLTTPPCSENVLWMVLKQPMDISKEQLRLFSQLFPNNARPTQPSNGRVVRNAQ